MEPEVTRTVFSGSRDLPASERQKVFANGTLLIRDTSRELDEGLYTCGAVNTRQERHERHLWIFILKKPVISSFRFPAHLVEGMSVIVTCSVLEGDAPIAVHWLKDGAALDAPSLNIHRNEMGDLGSSLVFRNIGHAHSGNYTCVAGNRVGQDSYTAEMAVKCECYAFF